MRDWCTCFVWMWITCPSWSGVEVACAAVAAPHAAMSVALTTKATAALAALDLMSCLLLRGALRRALGGYGRRPEPALDQRADLGDLANPQPPRQAGLLHHGVTLMTPDADDEG